MFERLVHTFGLASSLSRFRSGDIVGARRKLDRALATVLRDTDFILAYDAMVMVHEDRHGEARDRFQECLAEQAGREGPDAEFIRNFCGFYLAAYERRPTLKDIRQTALKLEIRQTLRRFLRFPSLDEIESFDFSDKAA